MTDNKTQLDRLEELLETKSTYHPHSDFGVIRGLYEDARFWQKRHQELQESLCETRKAAIDRGNCIRDYARQRIDSIKQEQELMNQHRCSQEEKDNYRVYTEELITALELLGRLEEDYFTDSV